jgi:hypothetical protein
MQMTAPPPPELRAALARCFVAPLPSEEIAALAAVLAAELHSAAAAPHESAIPRAVISLALWQLAEQHLSSEAKVPAPLAELVPAVFGCTLYELRCLRRARAEPWPLLARDYGILAYDVPLATDHAEISMVIDCPFALLPDLLDPRRWTTRASLFWSDIDTVKSEPGELQFTARFTLPDSRADVPVEVAIAHRLTPFGLDAELKIRARDRSEALDYDAHLHAGTPRGGAWTTRITRQTKRLAGTPANEMLAYWTQAETLCLALPE